MQKSRTQAILPRPHGPTLQCLRYVSVRRALGWWRQNKSQTCLGCNERSLISSVVHMPSQSRWEKNRGTVYDSFRTVSRSSLWVWYPDLTVQDTSDHMMFLHCSSDLETVTACSYPNLPDALPSSYDTKKIPNAIGKRTKPLTKARKNPEHCVNVSRRGWWLWVLVGLWKQVVTTVTTKHAKDRRGSCRHHVRICKEHLWGCKQRQPLCPSTGLCGHCQSKRDVHIKV